MNNERYESPEIKVISLEPDDSIMNGQDGGYSSGVEDMNS